MTRQVAIGALVLLAFGCGGDSCSWRFRASAGNGRDAGSDDRRERNAAACCAPDWPIVSWGRVGVAAGALSDAYAARLVPGKVRGEYLISTEAWSHGLPEWVEMVSACRGALDACVAWVLAPGHELELQALPEALGFDVRSLPDWKLEEGVDGERALWWRWWRENRERFVDRVP